MCALHCPRCVSQNWSGKFIGLRVLFGGDEYGKFSSAKHHLYSSDNRNRMCRVESLSLDVVVCASDIPATTSLCTCNKRTVIIFVLLYFRRLRISSSLMKSTWEHTWTRWVSQALLLSHVSQSEHLSLILCKWCDIAIAWLPSEMMHRLFISIHEMSLLHHLLVSRIVLIFCSHQTWTQTMSYSL